LLFGLGYDYLLLTQSVSFVYVAPSENTASGPFENAFYFVLIADLNGTVLNILLNWKSHKMMTTLIALNLTAASLFLSLVYLDAGFAYSPNFH
jgi:hypothetical protein